VRFRGWLTISAGLGLGALVAIQASRLAYLGRQEAARDEARGLSAALRGRLDFHRLMLDLNGTAMRRALQDLGRWPQGLEWAGLYGPDRGPLSSAGGTSSGGPADADFEALAACGPGDLPVLRQLPDGKFMAVTRFRIGERDLTLAMVLAVEGWRPGAAGLWSVLATCLTALVAAAFLLVWLGAIDILATRRPPPVG
jgi:hypothetical protein